MPLLVATHCYCKLKNFKSTFACTTEKPWSFTSDIFMLCYDAPALSIATIFYFMVFIEIFSGCRGLKNILRMHVKKVNCSEWEQVAVPKRWSSNIWVMVCFQWSFFGSCPWNECLWLYCFDLFLSDAESSLKIHCLILCDIIQMADYTFCSLLLSLVLVLLIFYLFLLVWGQ